MSLALRRILFTVCVIIFFLMGSILLFSGSGYWYNTVKKKVEKTGQLVVDSRPRGASLFLDGKPFFGEWWEEWTKKSLTTPFRIRSLFPGEYALTLTQEGFYPWEKRIVIFPGKATILGVVRLIKQSEPVFISSLQGGDFLSPWGEEHILVQFGTSVAALHTQTGVREDLFSLPKTRTNERLLVTVSPFGNAAVFRSESSSTLFSLNYPRSLRRIPFQFRQGSSFFWLNKDVLAFRDAKGQRLFLIRQGLPPEYLSNDERKLFSAGNLLFSLMKGEQGGVVLQSEKKGQNGSQKILFTFQEPQADFFLLAGRYLGIKSPQGIRLFFDISKERFFMVFLAGAHTASLINNERILASSDVELWTQSLITNEDDRKDLILRTGAPLQGAVFSDLLSAAVVSFPDNSLQFIEHHPQKTAATYHLSSFDSIRWLSFDERKQEVVIVGSHRGTAGLFRFKLTE